MKKEKDQQTGFVGRLPSKKVFLIIGAVLLVGGIGVGVGLIKASDNPAFCTACHIMEPYYESWHDSSLLANKHAEEGLECHDCHESSISIQAQEGLAFVTGNYETPLYEREFSREFCLECHDDFDEVTASTDHGEGIGNPHEPPHYDDMECNLCHSMHRESEVLCAECHEFEWIGELDDSWTN